MGFENCEVRFGKNRAEKWDWYDPPFRTLLERFGKGQLDYLISVPQAQSKVL